MEPSSLIPSIPLWLEAALCPGVLALIAFMTGRVSRSGAIGGWVMASIIWWSLGWPGILPPLVFFIAANLATAFGFEKKAARGIAQEDGGRRGAKHALANVSAGAALAIAANLVGEGGGPLTWAFAAAFATACADTVSSEIGQVLGQTPIHPLTFRRLEPGAEGAVSAEGTIAGILGGLIVALCGLIGGLYGEHPMPAVIVVTVAAAIANWLESALGSTWGSKFSNEGMNFFNTIAGGGIAWLLGTIWMKSIGA